MVVLPVIFGYFRLFLVIFGHFRLFFDGSLFVVQAMDQEEHNSA